MLLSTEASTLELLVTPPEPPMLPDLPRELARGLLMLMPTMAMLPSTEATTLELLVTPPEPPMLPGLPRVLEERGLLMLMLTMAILTPIDMDTLMPMDTELMDTLMVMPDGKQRFILYLHEK